MPPRQHSRKPGPGARPARRAAGVGRRGEGSGEITLYGLHAVAAALANPRRTVLRLRATGQAAARLAGAIAARGIAPDIVTAEQLAAGLPDGAVHQGVAARVAPLPPVELDALVPASPIIALDQVTDPHNVGAILRSAAAFDAAAVLAPDRNAPPPSAALAKAATGALEHVPYLRIGNLARTLGRLKTAGYWIVGLDGAAPMRIEEVADRAPVVLVLGAEGGGLRHLTRQTCDLVVRLDLPGPIKTLNVSNAAAIALYALARGAPS